MPEGRTAVGISLDSRQHCHSKANVPPARKWVQVTHKSSLAQSWVVESQNRNNIIKSHSYFQWIFSMKNHWVLPAWSKVIKSVMLINESSSCLQNYPKPFWKGISLRGQREKVALWFYFWAAGHACGADWRWPSASLVPYASWSGQLGSVHTLRPVSEVSAGHWRGSRAKDRFGNLIRWTFDCVYESVYIWWYKPV